jgi:hypothetical protein
VWLQEQVHHQTESSKDITNVILLREGFVAFGPKRMGTNEENGPLVGDNIAPCFPSNI